MAGYLSGGPGRRLPGSRAGAGMVLAAGAALVIVAGGLVAGCSSAGTGSLAASTGGSAASSSPSPSSSSSSSSSSSWVGVGELLVVKLSPTGAVSAAPYQHTEVTGSSTGTVKVEVPMSASGFRRLAGVRPVVTNGVGQFSFAPNGTATQNVRSDFAGQVPLTAKVSYELNGQPVQASALAPTRHLLKKHYKSGTLKVTYVISNVTQEKTTVSFEGFNGAHVTKTITDPIPMVAEVKLTFPKDATGISAPGASLATSKTGVKATWTLALAPPLSGASHTLSYSVHLSKAKAPEATVEAMALVPQSSPSGKVPQSAAAALANVEGQPEQGLGGSPESLGQVRSDNSGPQRSTNSKLESRKHALTRTKKTKPNAAARKIQPGLNQLSSTQTRDQQNMTAQGDAQLNGLNRAGSAQLNGLNRAGSAQLSRLNRQATAQLNGLRGTANRAVVTLASQVATGTAQAGASTGAVLKRLMDELAASLTSLGTLVSAHAVDASAAVLAANALAMSATALGTVTSDLTTATAQHAADATALDQLIVTLIADANALPVDVQNTPEWIQLAKDLAKAKAKADLVQGAAADIAQRAAALSTAVGKVQDQAVKLAADIKKLSAEAAGIHAKLAGDVTTAEHNLQSAIAHVSGKLGNFHAQIAAAQAKIDHKITGTQAKIDHKTSAVQAQITQATSSAQAKLGQATASLKASLNAASQKAQADLATAKQKVQASVQQAIGTAQTDLNKANNDYAQLLALTQIAQAHQLPGGNATGANIQNGAYVLRISSTG